jgi:hypothetical protein
MAKSILPLITLISPFSWSFSPSNSSLSWPSYMIGASTCICFRNSNIKNKDSLTMCPSTIHLDRRVHCLTNLLSVFIYLFRKNIHLQLTTLTNWIPLTKCTNTMTLKKSKTCYKIISSSLLQFLVYLRVSILNVNL